MLSTPSPYSTYSHSRSWVGTFYPHFTDKETGAILSGWPKVTWHLNLASWLPCLQSRPLHHVDLVVRSYRSSALSPQSHHCCLAKIRKLVSFIVIHFFKCWDSGKEVCLLNFRYIFIRQLRIIQLYFLILPWLLGGSEWNLNIMFILSVLILWLA